MKWLLENLQRVLLFAHELQEVSDDLSRLRSEVTQLVKRVDQLAHEMERERDNSKHEYEKMALWLQNQLLLLEHRVPPNTSGQ